MSEMRFPFITGDRSCSRWQEQEDQKDSPKSDDIYLKLLVKVRFSNLHWLRAAYGLLLSCGFFLEYGDKF